MTEKTIPKVLALFFIVGLFLFVVYSGLMAMVLYNHSKVVKDANECYERLYYCENPEEPYKKYILNWTLEGEG